MEGRARARPNQPRWRAPGVGQLPSMEGRARARPNPPRRTNDDHHQPPSMEGRARARPNAVTSPASIAAHRSLQWRAGHVPGQTMGSHHSRFARSSPLQWRAGHVPGQTLCAARWRRGTRAFNGGPGTCPAKRHPQRRRPAPHDPFNGGPGTCPAKRDGSMTARQRRELPSMEGRARARPNSTGQAVSPGRCALQWRAGHVPGQTSPVRTWRPRSRALQWRAGHVPGQTSMLRCRSGAATGLQWRAGHVPGQTAPEIAHGIDVSDLQWRAGHVPGQTASMRTGAASRASLQWRAGHVPGQTSLSDPWVESRPRTFNGGPGTCPAKPRR